MGESLILINLCLGDSKVTTKVKVQIHSNYVTVSSIIYASSVNKNDIGYHDYTSFVRTCAVLYTACSVLLGVQFNEKCA